MAKKRDRKTEVEIWLICYLPRDPLFFLVHSYIHYFLVNLVVDATPRTRHATNTRIASTHPRRVLPLLSFSFHAALLNYFKPLFGRNMTAGGRYATLCESAWLVVSDRDKEGKKREKIIKRRKKSSCRCRRLSKARQRYIFGWRVVLQRWIAQPGLFRISRRAFRKTAATPRDSPDNRHFQRIFLAAFRRLCFVSRVWVIIAENDQFPFLNTRCYDFSIVIIKRRTAVQSLRV